MTETVSGFSDEVSLSPTTYGIRDDPTPFEKGGALSDFYGELSEVLTLPPYLCYKETK